MGGGPRPLEGRGMKPSTDLFQRHKNNPIISTLELPIPALAVYNPGVAEFGGEVLLLLRVEVEDGRSQLHVARSKDGVSDWRVESEPLLSPESGDEYEEFGCEDPRITYIEELGEWVIAYTAVSSAGPAVALARTRDFKTVEKIGVVLPPYNKDAAVFPRRIGGKWMMLHRPVSDGIGHIWIAESPDLVNWGRPRIVLRERGGAWWDGHRVGAGAVPIETEEGWLLIYHGVKMTPWGPIYRLGLALLDLDDPSRVIARRPFPVLSPFDFYERTGNVPNVVFTCGALLRGDEVWLYYGAADTYVCLATAKLADLLEAVKEGTESEGG